MAKNESSWSRRWPEHTGVEEIASELEEGQDFGGSPGWGAEGGKQDGRPATQVFVYSETIGGAFLFPAQHPEAWVLFGFDGKTHGLVETD